MKEQTTESVDVKAYINPKAETQHKNFVSGFIKSIKEVAKRDAEEGVPLIKGDRFEHYLRPELDKLQLHNDLMNELHGGSDHSIEADIERKEFEHKEKLNERDELIAEIKQETAAYEKMQEEYPSLLAIVFASIVFLLCILDGLLQTESLRAFIPNRITATGVALLMGVALGIFAHKVPKWWGLGKSKVINWIIRLGIIIGFSTFFFFLGLLRSYVLRLSVQSVEQSQNTGLSLADPNEAVVFMSISLFFFLVAVFFSKYAPSFEQWKNIFRLSGKKKKLKHLQKKYEDTLRSIKEIKDDIDRTKQWDSLRRKKARRDEFSIIKLIPLAKSTYVQTNMRYRRGTTRPDCFDKDFKFYLTTYYQKGSNKGNNTSAERS